MSSGLAFSGVILDLDGLLLDTERWTVERGPELFAAYGFDFSTDFFHSLVGISDIEGAQIMSAQSGRAVDTAFVEKVWRDAMDGLTELPLRPGVLGFLDALDAHKLPRAVATNSVTDRAQWKLKVGGLLSRVDVVVGRDQVAHAKPAPDVYLEAARRLGISPGDCAALDDSDVGVRAAVDAGVKIVVQIPDMMPSTERAAHHQAESLTAAIEILGL